jgi:hypothetical protein
MNAHVRSSPEYIASYTHPSKTGLHFRSQPSSSTRPVSGPLTTTRNDTQELTGDDAVRLLARVQLIVPQETVRIRLVRAVHIASETGDIERR